MDQRSRIHRRIAQACQSAGTPNDLLRLVKESLAPYVPSDRWCCLTLDPATSLATGGFHEEGVTGERARRIMELEFEPGAVNALSDLARARESVSTLSLATGGQPERSARYQQALAPEGISHELRAVFRDPAGPWGALVLLRAAGRDFSMSELSIVSGVVDEVTAALRRVLLLGEIEARETSGADPLLGPALILINAEEDLEIESASTGAAAWLQQIEDTRVAGLPYALYTLAQRARHSGRGIARLRTRGGRWVTVHAEALGGPSRISLIIQPSRPYEIAQVLSCAYGLTAREGDVARLVARGCSNAEIAQMLKLSRYTVEDHLKNIYEKVSVRSRSELVSRLFFDQYITRSAGSAGLDGDGWFLAGNGLGKDSLGDRW